MYLEVGKIKRTHFSDHNMAENGFDVLKSVATERKQKWQKTAMCSHLII